jgi:hypothetical protein
MICTTCGKTADPVEFTKTNRSKDGKRAMCKQCKAIRDANFQKRKKESDNSLPYFNLTPDRLTRSVQSCRIGVLVLKNHTDRETDINKTYFQKPNQGMAAILSELKEPHEYCGPETINNYEYVLLSLNSVLDIENLIYSIERFAPQNRTAKIIAGGFGLCNVKLIKDYIDIAVFGRAEGQINDIIFGFRFPNVWRKVDDPGITGDYEFRRPRYLVDGETSVGCRNKCAYCQYTWIRPQLIKGEKYQPGKTMHTQETDWNGLIVDKPGRYNTAWDGWSEASRRKVHKPVTNADIADKLVNIGNAGHNGTVYLSIYQIVGYPWETEESTLQDIRDVGSMLAGIDKQIDGSITIQFVCTPFSPEPMTPMQYEPANISTNWRFLCNLSVCKGSNITAFIGPMIGGPFALMKRVMTYRAEADGIDMFKRIAFNSKLNGMAEQNKVSFLIKHGYIDAAMFGKIDHSAFDYLSVEPIVRPPGGG